MDIAAWLRRLGLERYERAFRDNEVDGAVLPKLTADDLKDMGIAAVGHRRVLLEAIAALRGDTEPRPPASPRGSADPAPSPAPRAVPPAARAERRQLTVMFVDLVGSTALSTSLDPEEMQEVLRAYRNEVAGEVARFQGHARMDRGLRGYQATGSCLFLPYWLALLAKALAEAGRHPEALAALAEAREWTERTDQRWIEAELHRLEGRMTPRTDVSDVETALTKAIAVARAQAARIWELRAACDLARFLAERGERRRAHDLLAPVYGWFGEGFATPDLQEAGVLLDALH